MEGEDVEGRGGERKEETTIVRKGHNMGREE